MVFSSTVFLFIFLPTVLIFNFLLKQEYRNFFLFLVSLVFYAWGEGILVVLMLFSISVNYIFGLGISYFRERNLKVANLFLGLSITINLGLLLYYKYANFLIQTLQEIGFYLDYNHKNILLPIGISFFTFQGISYLVDVYRQEVSVQRNFFHLGLYISFFPQLIAGPIVRYHDISKKIESRSIDIYLFTEGVIRFIRGLAKKVLIANNAALIADQVFSIPSNEVAIVSAWLGIFCYTIQIYFDFSGYSDMAIGLGKMLGFNFKENFNYPYIAKSIQDFWRRWHISLSTWFRDYLYIPLGGNRKGLKRTYFNLIFVFFITGLWHGASFNFIFWGLFHGVFILLERIRFLDTKKWPKVVQHLYVLLVVIIGWVFFRAETMEQAIMYMGSLIGLFHGVNVKALFYVNTYSITMILIAIIFSMPFRHYFNNFIRTTGSGFLVKIYDIGVYFFYTALFVLSAIELAQSSYNPFIYFRF